MKEQPLLLNYQFLLKIFLYFIFFGFAVFAQAQKITVKDTRNEPLEGVAIIGSAGTYFTISDKNGTALLSDKVKYPITFQYIGFKNLILSEEELKKSNFIVLLQEDQLLIDEIVLIGRTDIAQEDLAFESTEISPADIQLTNAQTTTDALVANSSVYVQKSQMGGGSPVIRGFEANKLLLVVDGVRMNNTIYRSGHLQNAITVDPAILENMEVIFGPGSLMYGSDALGGVVHFQSKDLNLGKKPAKSIDATYYFRYGSSNDEKTGHIDFTYYGNKWASLTSATISDFGDLTIGENRASKYDSDYGLRPFYVASGVGTEVDKVVINPDPNTMLFTAYKQYDFLQKFKFQFSDQVSLVWNNQYSTSSDIPRYDALTEIDNSVPTYSRWDYGPQDRFMSSVNVKYVPINSKIYDKLQMIVAYQKVHETRITSRFESELVETQDEALDIINTTWDLSRTRGAHQWYIGVDANYNYLDSKAFQSTYTDMTIQEAGLTRYPNGEGVSLSSGAYAQYYFIPQSWYKLNAGIRYDYNQVNVRFDEDNIFQWPDYFYEGVQNKNRSLNGSVGLHIKLPANFKLRGLAGTSFRAPNIDDIAKIRLSNDEISVPNDQLNPEKSLNGELTIAYQTNKTEISITGFYTNLSDAVVRANFSLPNGETQYITQGDTFNIVTNINAEKARIRGVSINYNQQIREGITLDASLNFTQGDIIKNKEKVAPLAHIPPAYGRLFLQWEQDKFRGRFGGQFNGKKSIERFGGSTDNPEFASEEGALSWYTLHITAEYRLHSLLSLQLGIDNILDQFYVPFASGIPGAGRHISFTLRGNINR